MPSRLPSDLCSALTSAVRDEVAAGIAQSAARGAFTAAVRRTTSAARALRAAGAPLTSIASVIARELGNAPTVAERQRIASRFRRRFAREGIARRTASHADLLAPSPAAPSSPLPSEQPTEDVMTTRLVKRTVEEFVEDEAPKKARAAQADEGPDGEGLDVLVDVGFEDDEDEDERPRGRRKS
jgi:hypothetical protein